MQKAPPPPTITFVHLYGSHNNACDRVNYKYDTYYRSERVSCYIQSLKNTDKLLSDIVDKLKTTKGTWKFIYFGDHGQGLNEKGTENENYSHTQIVKEGYETALFITTSNDTKRKIIDHPRTGYNIFSMLMELGNVKDPLVNNTCDLFNNIECEENKEIYIVANDKRKLLSSLPREK